MESGHGLNPPSRPPPQQGERHRGAAVAIISQWRSYMARRAHSLVSPRQGSPPPPLSPMALALDKEGTPGKGEAGEVSSW
jgi:hypothetical protein